jgi:hypothetical protein
VKYATKARYFRYAIIFSLSVIALIYICILMCSSDPSRTSAVAIPFVAYISNKSFKEVMPGFLAKEKGSQQGSLGLYFNGVSYIEKTLNGTELPVETYTFEEFCATSSKFYSERESPKKK